MQEHVEKNRLLEIEEHLRYSSAGCNELRDLMCALASILSFQRLSGLFHIFFPVSQCSLRLYLLTVD